MAPTPLFVAIGPRLATPQRHGDVASAIQNYDAESFNEENFKLYQVLDDTHIFLLGISPSVLWMKLHVLQPSFQAILGHSIAIISSCYLEHTEEDIISELNYVFGKIEHIKYECQAIKLYYFPQVDDLGFLECFSGYLEDLMNNQEISAKEEINSLHLEVHSLFLLAKVTNQEEFNGSPWTDIINMAYQAEYFIDLYLASSFRDFELISSLSEIIKQLNNIRANVHGLSSNILPTQDAVVTSRTHVQGTTTQISDNHAIVSFQEEPIIKKYLLNNDSELDFISIFGMAGVGKTTLASALYNTDSVAGRFDILAWCTVSQSYQNRDVLLKILDQVGGESAKSDRSKLDDQELADNLWRSLRKRRYLIVLDDVWHTALWNYLKRYLPNDRNGSRVLITTRHRGIAEPINGKVNEIHGLSDEKSWELFQKRMHEKEPLSDNLLKISKEIIGNCKGLPLSIVIIAGILTDMERTVKKWNQIAESVSSVILSHGQCKAILELSYNHLPNHLRSCFLYIGSFPEDKEILLDHLINLWIAEGFVRETKSESAEEVAEKYMKDLIVKSLVIPVKERSLGGVKTFRLHDLLRDFCLDKAKEKHFCTMLGKRDDSLPLQDPRRLIINGPLSKGRHFSYHSIRSMICFGSSETPQINMEIGFGDMVLLKVLDVVGLWLNDFPNLSGLVHLRYLALCLQSSIAVLPSSISKLQNLQFLILDCGYVIEIPDFIWDMVKLKHIDISPKASFQVDRYRVWNSSFLLEKLRSLSKARVSIGDSKWLSKLSGLQTLCCIFVGGDLRVDDEDDDLQEDEENGLQMLSFNGHLSSLSMEGRKQRIVSTCQLPISLRELSLSGFLLTVDDISGIGKALPLLEVFEIFSCYMPDRYPWNVDDDEFPELKILKLRDLEICKWIASENSFPSLKQLWLEKCDYLDEIPLQFGYLPNLHLISVRDCAPSVDNSAREIEKQQHEDQNTEMRVRVYPKRHLSILKAKYHEVHGHRYYFNW